VTICNVRKIVIALSDDGKSVTFMMASTKYRHRQTDRQTDRQTCYNNIALCMYTEGRSKPT